MIDLKQTPEFDTSELNRRLANLIRVGTIEQARYDEEGKPSDPEVPWFSNEDQNGFYRGPLYRVRMLDHLTYWIPQLQLRAGEDQSYTVYEVGEQVMVFSPSGDPMQGMVFGALPSDKYRPPVGLDDQSKDLRPWRESIERKRYKDGCLVEYDRYLHRFLSLYPDKTQFTAWFHDDREDRSPHKKETNSDKINVPPRHLWQWDFHGESQYQYIHDEDEKFIHNHQQFDDGTVLEFTWDYEKQTHTHHWHYADDTDYSYHYDEKAQTHRQDWLYPDGRVVSYFWDEKSDLHEAKVTHADGRIETQSSQGGNSLKRIEFADGTSQTYRHGDTNSHETQYRDGSFVVYNLDTQEMHCHSKKRLKASAVEELHLDAPNIVIKGDVTVDGNINNTGKITSEGKHKAKSFELI